MKVIWYFFVSVTLPQSAINDVHDAFPDRVVTNRIVLTLYSNSFPSVRLFIFMSRSGREPFGFNAGPIFKKNLSNRSRKYNQRVTPWFKMRYCIPKFYCDEWCIIFWNLRVLPSKEMNAICRNFCIVISATAFETSQNRFDSRRFFCPRLEEKPKCSEVSHN